MEARESTTELRIREDRTKKVGTLALCKMCLQNNIILSTHMSYRIARIERYTRHSQFQENDTFAHIHISIYKHSHPHESDVTHSPFPSPKHSTLACSVRASTTDFIGNTLDPCVVLENDALPMTNRTRCNDGICTGWPPTRARPIKSATMVGAKLWNVALRATVVSSFTVSILLSLSSCAVLRGM